MYLRNAVPKDVTTVNTSNPNMLKWISDTVLSNFCCHATLADTPDNLVHNTKNFIFVKLYY